MGLFYSKLFNEAKDRDELSNSYKSYNCELKNKSSGKYPLDFQNLVIEGGGVKIVSIMGTLKALREYRILDKIDNYAGSSAGSIACALLSVGYQCKEVDEVILGTNFKNFLDDSFGVIRDTVRFMKSYGICKGEYFQNWMNDQLKNKTGIDNITFSQIKKKYGKELNILSLCVEDSEIRIFSWRTDPNMSVPLAVRMSMSIPYLFTPVKHKGKTYIDSGISDNYPIDLFDTYDRNKKITTTNKKTLGLKMMGSTEKRDSKIFYDKMETDTLASFSTSLLTHILEKIERLQVKKDYWERTITIPTGSIGMIDFDINNMEKSAIARESYKIAVHYVEYYKKHGVFPPCGTNC